MKFEKEQAELAAQRFTRKELCAMLDSTNLNPTGTSADIKKLAEDAVRYGFALVMVHPCFVKMCVAMLKGTGVRVGSVVDFPLGAGGIAWKIWQTKGLAELGADEIDVVAGACCTLRDLKELREAAMRKTLKIILETCNLSSERIAELSSLCTEAGVDFIKTSTGFGSRGASLDDIKIIKKATTDFAAQNGLPPCRIKASGGVRTLKQLTAFYDAGATRFGTSNAVSIIEERIKEESQ